MLRQVEIKAEQIARMIVKGIPGTRIAIEMGMSYAGLMRILRQPEYLDIEERVRNCVVNKMDARLAKRAEMSDEVEDAVPEAMEILLNTMRKKRDLKAALELLDRDPRRQFAKQRAASAADASMGAATGVSGVSSETLAQAVKDADITHTLLRNQQQQAASVSSASEASVMAKPGEA